MGHLVGGGGGNEHHTYGMYFVTRDEGRKWSGRGSAKVKKVSIGGEGGYKIDFI